MFPVRGKAVGRKTLLFHYCIPTCFSHFFCLNELKNIHPSTPIYIISHLILFLVLIIILNLQTEICVSVLYISSRSSAHLTSQSHGPCSVQQTQHQFKGLQRVGFSQSTITCRLEPRLLGYSEWICSLGKRAQTTR